MNSHIERFYSYIWAMKKHTWIAIVVISLGLNLKAQKTLAEFAKAPLVMVMSKTPMGAYPVYFEETDSSAIQIKNGDTTRTEFIVKYIDRRKPLSKSIRKTKITRDKISIWHNDTLRVDVKRQSELHNGTIGGKKGKVERSLIPSRNPSIHATEQYMIQGDSSNFIVYRPELGQIELESSNKVQYRRMLGNLFSEICSYPSGKQEFTPLNRSLRKGDELQILFNFEALNEQGNAFTSTPNRLMTVVLGDFVPNTDPSQMSFNSKLTDLEYSTVFDETSSVIEFYDEGFAINYHVYLKDSLYTRTLRIYPPEAPIRLHPFYPSIDLAGPLIEGTYEHSVSIDDTVLNVTSYWNSADGTRINYLPEFAFPWLDNAENFIGSPVYLNLSGNKVGKPYQVEENKNMHFARIAPSRDSLVIEVYSPEKQNINLELQQLDGQTIKVLKQAYGLKKGVTRIALEKLGLPYGSKADLVLFSVEKSGTVEQQRFRYTELN